MWKFSYSFRIMAIFLLHKLNSCRRNYWRGKLFKGGNYSRKYGNQNHVIIKSYFLTYLAYYNYLSSLKKWLTIRIWRFLLAKSKMWLNLERTLTHSLKRNLCELEITTFNLCLSICRMFKILPKHDSDLALSFTNVHY